MHQSMYEPGMTEETCFYQKDIYSGGVHGFKEFIVETINLLPPTVRFVELGLGFSSEHPVCPHSSPRH